MSVKPKYPVVEGTKKCRKCGKTLPLEEFYFRTRATGNKFYASWCKECVKNRRRQHYEENRERCSERSRIWRDNNRERWDFIIWRSYIMRKYKLTPEEYDKLAGDPPRCKICGCERSPKRRLHVDHCHEKNIVRGILCVLCNRAIERMEAVPDWAAKAQAYLAAAA